MATLSALMLSLLASPAAQAQEAEPAPAIEVTFLGNEGFLLSAGGRKVLVDALVSREMPAYVVQDDALREKLEKAQPPFDDVDLVLASHRHGDHFDPRAVGAHLAANPKARFVSTEQAVELLEEHFDGWESVRARVRAVAPTETEPVRVAELGLTVFNLHHGRSRKPPVQNHGFVIELGGRKVLHLGDSEAKQSELAGAGLKGLAVDVALVPVWYVDASPGKGTLDGIVTAMHIVPMHLAPGFARDGGTVNQTESLLRVKRVQKAYPNAVVFREPGQSRLLELVR